MNQKIKARIDDGVDAPHGKNDMSEAPVPVFIEDAEGLDMPENISTRAARFLPGRKPGETIKDVLARF